MSHIGKLHKLKCQTLRIFDSIIVGPQNDDTTSIICQFGTRSENAVMSERLKTNVKVEVYKENMDEVRQTAMSSLCQSCSDRDLQLRGCARLLNRL
jgi:hypothetical protein